MRRVPLKTMADWCRALGSPLRAGLNIKESLRLAARSGGGDLGRLNSLTLEKIEAGDDLPDALEKIPYRLPVLFHAMAQVGARTGRFPEILRELENYFRFQLRLRREFLQQIFWPVLQLNVAIWIIAGMMFVIGMLATPMAGHKPFDPIGLGVGVPGALRWLLLCYGSFAFVAVGYYLVKTVLGMGEKVDAFLLRVPVLGPCLTALAMARLCLAMRMTMDSNLSVGKSIPLSLEATDNPVFVAVAPEVVAAVRKRGTNIADAFAAHSIFPEEFLHVLRTSEEAGSIPEEMGRLAEHYNETARMRLQLLNQAAGWAVWSLVAGVIIFLIFRMALSYIGMLNKAVNDPMGF